MTSPAGAAPTAPGASPRLISIAPSPRSPSTASHKKPSRNTCAPTIAAKTAKRPLPSSRLDLSKQENFLVPEGFSYDYLIARSMRILLIGGNGFIGRFVVAALKQQGHALAVFHRGTTAAPCGVDEIRGDRNQLNASARELKHFAPDVVIDLVISSK